MHSGLKSCSLYLYFGHGGGEDLISQRELAKLEPAPVALLFGCSSGFLKSFGEFDSDGICLEFLKAGRYFIIDLVRPFWEIYGT